MAFSNVADAWKQRNFAIYMTGAGIALVGMWAQRIAVAWLAWELTKSTTWLGLIAFADLFPTIILTPIAGVIADRMDRRKLSLISQFAAFLQAIVLTVLVYTDWIDIWSLFFLTFLLGIAMAYATAARLAMVPNLMEAAHVPSALASDAAIYNSARVVGPMLAAVLIAFVGIAGAFLVNCLTYVVFLVCLMKIRLVRNESRGRTGGMLAQTLEGMRYAAKHPGIGPMLIVLTALAISVKPFLDLLPGLADNVFNSGVNGFAQLAAAGGTGAVLCAIWFALRGRIEGLTFITLSALIVGPLGIVLMCISDMFWLGLIGSFIAGSSITLTGTGVQTLMQHSVDGAIRGRVLSLYGMLHRGVPALGALLMGIMGDQIGLQATLIGGALIFCVPVFFWVLLRWRRLRSALEGPPIEA
ncbi:MAG: MFS transporter [Alphaproteobacteria bacterium]